MNHRGHTMFKRLLFLLWIPLAINFQACQQESEQIAPVPPDQAVTIDSQVAQMLLRLVMLDGSGDNILDGASCSSMIFPIQAVVNGQTMTIQTEDDLDAIERIIDESDSDDDSVAIQFPITVTFPDYSTQAINSQAEFEQLIEDCVEGGEDDDIECLDLTYPLSVAIYDTANQKSNTLTLSSDKEVYQFLNQLTNNVLIALQFPVSLVDSAGNEATVNDYEELEDLLLGSDDCDEDDDNDFDDDDLDTGELHTVISSGTWVVDLYFDKTDQTSQFAGYTFAFAPDSTATATLGGTVLPGGWALYGDSGILEWDMEFKDEPVDELNEDWKVVSFTTSVVQLADKPGDPEAKRLTFRKP